MTTQRRLNIWAGPVVSDEIVERLRDAGHIVERVVSMEYPDLIIGANSWHLPASAPDPDAYVDAAVEWMQKRKYPPKPAKKIPTVARKRLDGGKLSDPL